MRSYFLSFILLFTFSAVSYGQVDSSYLYDPHTPYGALDIRVSRGKGHSFFIEENRTFSFRANNGEPTNTYLKMTAWDSSPYGEGHLKEKTDTTERFIMNYRMLRPVTYDRFFREGYPLVIVMHGLHERGNCAGEDCYHADENYAPEENIPAAPNSADHPLLNNDYSLVHGGKNYLAAQQSAGAMSPDNPDLPADAFPGFVLFPQNFNGWDQAASENVIRLVRLMCQKYNIDENRIYLNGISHGGHGAYEVLKRAPWMFAAAVLFSAADDAALIHQGMTPVIAGVPLWIFQGALDTHPTQDNTEKYVKAFRESGASVRYTLYSNLGHGTWNKAMAEPDFFTWMLSKRRTDIHVFGGQLSICPTADSGTLLSLPAGFDNYEWEYDGQAVGGANMHTLWADRPGIYRGRFGSAGPSSSDDQWNPWSAELRLTLSEPKVGVMKQIGTLLLPDLNGNENAVLEADGDHAYYHWYKDGVALQSPIPADSLKRKVISPEQGNGMISVRIAGYDHCKSAPSEMKSIVFNDEARLSLASPFDIRAEATSKGVLLSWSDTAMHEHGFEIWRRTLEGETDSSLWKMVVLTDPNAAAYSDNDVSPSSGYAYKIRAVNDAERSEYAPALEGLIIATPTDHEPPGAPRNLKAIQAGVNTIELSWTAATDNASVRNYIIYFNNDSIHTSSADTTFLLNDLAVNTVYSFDIRAVDHAGNIGAPGDIAHQDTFLSGLYYTHSTGAWQTLKEVDWSVEEFTGVVEDFTLAPKTQDDFFNFTFDGYLSIEKRGVYQFRITSDDGSSLSLNDTLLIENDGIHNVHTVTGPIQVLKRGPQRITVKYFDFVSSDILVVEYKGPDTGKEWTTIPARHLTSDLVASTDDSQHDLSFDFTVYPNPTIAENINIRMSSGNAGPISFRLTDLSGRVLFETTVDFKEAFQTRIPEGLGQGMYIVSIKQGVSMLSKKIMIK